MNKQALPSESAVSLISVLLCAWSDEEQSAIERLNHDAGYLRSSSAIGCLLGKNRLNHVDDGVADYANAWRHQLNAHGNERMEQGTTG
jgi:hypothetical protein